MLQDVTGLVLLEPKMGHGALQQLGDVGFAIELQTMLAPLAALVDL